MARRGRPVQRAAPRRRAGRPAGRAARPRATARSSSRRSRRCSRPACGSATCARPRRCAARWRSPSRPPTCTRRRSPSSPPSAGSPATTSATHIASLAAHYRPRRDALLAGLARAPAARAARGREPEGGLFVWVTLPAGLRRRGAPAARDRPRRRVRPGPLLLRRRAQRGDAARLVRDRVARALIEGAAPAGRGRHAAAADDASVPPASGWWREAGARRRGMRLHDARRLTGTSSNPRGLPHVDSCAFAVAAALRAGRCTPTRCRA